MTRLALTLIALAAVASTSNAFAPVSSTFASRQQQSVRLYEEKKDASEAVFVPPPEASDEESKDEEVPLETVESLGRGAAKVRT